MNEFIKCRSGKLILGIDPVGCAIFGVLLSVPLPADEFVEWESVSKFIAPDVLNESTKVEFAFHNTTPDPVRIMNLRSSCGCVVPLPDATPTPSGADGAVKLFVAPIPSPAPVQRLVQLTVAGATSTDVQLVLNIQFPIAPKVSPDRLAWGADDDDWKAFGITLPANHPECKVIGVGIDPSDWQIRLESDDDLEDFSLARSISLLIRPLTSQKRRTTVDIVVWTGLGPKVLRVHLANE